MRATLVAVAAVLALVALTAVAAGHPSEEGERYASVEWQPNLSEGEPAGRKIGILYTYRGCAGAYRHHRTSVRETDDSVTIKVLAHYKPPPPDTACPAVLGGGRDTVKLKKPLGDRELRHAATNDDPYR